MRYGYFCSDHYKILVRVHATGVNPVDAMVRSGRRSRP
jgi:NADPH:quinone reductase-like Zn-dependent oxidoreductase